MVTVDSRGRIVLPQEVRERLGITPGTEVEVHEEDGRAVIEPETDPDAVLGRMEELIAEAASDRAATRAPDADHPTADHPIAERHAAAVRRGAEGDGDE